MLIINLPWLNSLNCKTHNVTSQHYKYCTCGRFSFWNRFAQHETVISSCVFWIQSYRVIYLFVKARSQLAPLSPPLALQRPSAVLPDARRIRNANGSILTPWLMNAHCWVRWMTSALNRVARTATGDSGSAHCRVSNCGLNIRNLIHFDRNIYSSLMWWIGSRYALI